MESKKPKVSMIVAIGKNRVIGKGNTLLWHLPEDLKRFKSLTLGHPCIMGRKTFDSLPPKFRPLPGRTNIVVTRDESWAHEGAVVAHSLDEALQKASVLDQTEIFIIGGAQIYEAALHHTDRLYLTLIDDEKDGDAYFPAYETEVTHVLNEEAREQDGLKFVWKDVER